MYILKGPGVAHINGDGDKAFLLSLGNSEEGVAILESTQRLVANPLDRP